MLTNRAASSPQLIAYGGFLGGRGLSPGWQGTTDLFLIGLSTHRITFWRLEAHLDQ